MSKINELVQIGTRQVTKTRVIPATYGETGAELTPETTETYTEDAPVMGTVTRDMTAQEEADYLAAQADAPEPEQTETERLEAVETKTAQHDTEIEQIVTGLEALANGG